MADFGHTGGLIVPANWANLSDQHQHAKRRDLERRAISREVPGAPPDPDSYRRVLADRDLANTDALRRAAGPVTSAGPPLASGPPTASGVGSVAFPLPASGSGGPPPVGLSTRHIPPRLAAPRKTGILAVARGGAVVKLKAPRLAGDDARARSRRAALDRKERGKIKGFSYRSRSRLMQLLGSLDRRQVAGLPLFLHLTYPATWPEEPEVWKRHLEAFIKRLVRWAERAYPGAKVAAVWRLEPQRRGAPHYHIMLFGVRFIPYQWVAKAWAQVIGGGADSVAAGTRIERVRSWRGVMSYASKYLAKRGGHGGGFEGVGRHWGVVGRENLPTDWQTFLVPFFAVRRILWAYRERKGGKVRRVGFDGFWLFMDWGDGVRLGLAYGGP